MSAVNLCMDEIDLSSPRRIAPRAATKQRRLYGRHYETAELELRERFARAIGSTTTSTKASHKPVPQFVFVTGPAGVGKRTLVESALQPVVDEARGILVTACCAAPIDDRFCYGEARQQTKGKLVSPPYQNVLLDSIEYVLEAIDQREQESLLNDVLPRFFSTRYDWKRLTELLCPLDHLALVEKISLECTYMNDEQGQQSDSRQLMLPMLELHKEVGPFLARFLSAVASCHPLVIVLDQAHYIDTDTIEAIEYLMKNDVVDSGSSTKGVTIVLCYRNDGTAVSGAMSGFLRKIQETCVPSVQPQFSGSKKSRAKLFANGEIHIINTGSLTREAVTEWIKDQVTIHVGDDDDAVHEATEYFMDITNGNPRFLRYLLLYMDWKLDLNCIEDEIPQKVEEVYDRLLSRCGDRARNVVEAAAGLCICGCSTVSLGIIELVFQQPCNDVIMMLVKYGLLEVEQNVIRFPNQELLVAAYYRIPECDRALVHLRIGRRIWKYSVLSTDDETIIDGELLYTISQQLYQGLSSVTNVEERRVFATVFLRAGKKAMRSALFHCAASHFECSLFILGDDAWSTNCYDLSLDVHNCVAEACYCIGDFLKMDRALDAVCKMAASFQDKLLAYLTFVHANGARNRMSEAVDMALYVLDELGEHIDKNPSKWVVLMADTKTLWTVRHKRHRYFLSLPCATNPDKVAAITLLNFMFMYSYVSKLECAKLSLYHMLQLTRTYGLTGAAINAYAQYGFFLCSLGQMDGGYRFGQVALSLLDRLDSSAWLPRVHYAVYGIINPWMCPIRESLSYLQIAHRSAFKTGDIFGGAISATVYFKLAFYGSAPIPVLEEEARSFLRLMDSMGQVTGVIYLLPMWKLFLNLTSIGRLGLDEENELQKWTDLFDIETRDPSNVFAKLEKVWRAIYFFYMGEHEFSLEMAEIARIDQFEMDPGLEFYAGLSSLILSRSAKRGERSKLLRIGRRVLTNYKRWARSCPANFRHRDSLLRAEWACLHGKTHTAQTLYNDSILAAKEEGFVHEEGVAYERLAHHHSSLGHMNSALPCYAFAMQTYSRWGAYAVVSRLQDFMATKFGRLSQVPLQSVTEAVTIGDDAYELHEA